jgi:hypothetical protein
MWWVYTGKWDPGDMNKNMVGLYRLMGSLGYEQKCGGLIPVNGILGT